MEWPSLRAARRFSWPLHLADPWSLMFLLVHRNTLNGVTLDRSLAFQQFPQAAEPVPLVTKKWSSGILLQGLSNKLSQVVSMVMGYHSRMMEITWKQARGPTGWPPAACYFTGPGTIIVNFIQGWSMVSERWSLLFCPTWKLCHSPKVRISPRPYFWRAGDFFCPLRPFRRAAACPRVGLVRTWWILIIHWPLCFSIIVAALLYK